MNYSFLAERNLCSNANANAFAQNNQLNRSCVRNQKNGLMCTKILVVTDGCHH